MTCQITCGTADVTDIYYSQDEGVVQNMFTNTLSSRTFVIYLWDLTERQGKKLCTQEMDSPVLPESLGH